MMNGRGQDDFVRLPSFAARFYENLNRTSAIQRQQREIASDLAARIDSGRVLDVGTGPGYLLLELYRLNPALELFGLDISAAMVNLAQRNLSGFIQEVRQGTIQHTEFEEDFFDLITCTGSFYLWNRPQECLDEVYRILKPRRQAFLFETYRDCDKTSVRLAIAANLRRENPLRRIVASRLFTKQLGMTYRISEVSDIVVQTRFAESHEIERIVLAGVPASLRITLTKLPQPSSASQCRHQHVTPAL